MSAIAPTLKGQNGLLIGVVAAAEELLPTSQMLLDLSQRFGRKIDDVCCLVSAQRKPNLFKILTTHASAWVEGGQVDIAKGFSSHEGMLLCQLRKKREEMLIALGNRKHGEEFPYPSIRGRVILAGNTPVLSSVFLPALGKIFLVNGAREVEFIDVSSLTVQ